jgi:hypothetical protein
VRPGREAGGQVRGKAGEPGGHEHAFVALGISWKKEGDFPQAKEYQGLRCFTLSINVIKCTFETLYETLGDLI